MASTSVPSSATASPSASMSSLTPRAKIRALLATVGGDSDSEVSPSATKTAAATTDRSVEFASLRDAAPIRTTTLLAQDEDDEDDEDDDDEDEDILPQPRGGGLVSKMRAAAAGGEDNSAMSARERVRRMLALDAGSSSPKRSPAADDGDDEARGRVRRLLSVGSEDGGNALPATDEVEDLAAADAPPSSQPPPQDEAEEDDDDDEVLPVAPRRGRLVQRAAAKSPSPEQGEEEEQQSLFVSPAKSDGGVVGGSDGAGGSDSGSDSDDLPSNPLKSVRFQELVARRRRERLEREAEEARKREERIDRQEQLLSEAVGEEDDGDVDDDEDGEDEGGRKLTQVAGATRPMRKASKKALEEMHRETQRISRGLQLAHEAKTKKKITKAALFERFNFRPEGSAAIPATKLPTPVKTSSSSAPATPKSAAAADTDVDMHDLPDTPPSSPPPLMQKLGAESAASKLPQAMASIQEVVEPVAAAEAADDELPSLDAVLSAARTAAKGKGKATAADLALDDGPQLVKEAAVVPKRQFRVKLPPPSVAVNHALVDSDDELQITMPGAKTKLDLLFEAAPARREQEAPSVRTLRRLAQLSSPSKAAASASGGVDERMRRRFGKAAAAEHERAHRTLTAAELAVQLRERARAQAREERERRVEALRAKGVVVQSAEDRERERDAVEDIVARARLEAEEIMHREKEEAKKERRERRRRGEDVQSDEEGGGALAFDDSDDDESYVGEVEEKEVELSGSEEEEEGKGDEDEEMEDAEELAGGDSLLDNEADETDDDEREELADDDEVEAGFVVDDSDDESAPVSAAQTRKPRRSAKHVHIVSDDEDDDDDVAVAVVEATPKAKPAFPKSPAAAMGAAMPAGPATDSPHAPTSVLRSATKPFIPGLPVPISCPAGLGLTQIFMGTMDDSQASGGGGSQDFAAGSAEMMPDFDAFPRASPSQFADRSLAPPEQRELSMLPVPDSQQQQQEDEDDSTSQAVRLHVTQTQLRSLDSLAREDSAAESSLLTQASDFFEPTQDAGFQGRTPLKERFVAVGAGPLPSQMMAPPPPASTVDTVVAGAEGPHAMHATEEHDAEDDDSAAESPLVRRKGRLRRKADVAAKQVIEQADSDDGLEEDEFGFGTKDAFAVINEAAIKKKAADQFSKKKSRAKEMVEDQAEESEDEYAGLGGADGEDSDDNDDASVKEMIDDEGGKDVDERKIAAFHADRERAADEKQVEKLFHDITSGMLRRKRGAGGGGGEYDLSDSDDGGEARRRAKRRQFAKMQRALFADERIGRIAENPRNLAFLRSIEDRGSDDDEDMAGWGDIIEGANKGSASNGEDESGVDASNTPGSAVDAAFVVPDSQPGPATTTASKTTRPTTTMTAAPSKTGGSNNNNGPSSYMRPPAPQRRTAAASDAARRRATTLGEVRESLSTLLDDDASRAAAGGSTLSSRVEDTDLDDDDDSAGDDEVDKDMDKENLSPRRRRRSNKGKTPPRKHRPAPVVIDRISLRRTDTGSSASSVASNTVANGPLAFAAAAPSTTATAGAPPPAGFRVPALLRRATTNSLLSTGSSASSSTSSLTTTTTGNDNNTNNTSAGFGDAAKLKRSAGRRSGVHYFAREAERRAQLADKEKRREAKKWRGAEQRAGAVGGLFGGGSFE